VKPVRENEGSIIENEVREADSRGGRRNEEGREEWVLTRRKT
jgi:hypothetical protein